MFKILNILLLSLLPFGLSILYDNNELKRQYNNFRKMYKKQDIIENGYENFIMNLHKIENFNKINNSCKLYLTQYSDTDGESSVYNTCSNIKIKKN